MSPADALEGFVKVIQEVCDKAAEYWHELEVLAARHGYDLGIPGEFERWLEGDKYGLWT